MMIEAIQDYIKLEKDMERMKIDISIKDDYNLIDAFGVIDKNGKGYITASELKEALEDLGVNFTIDEIHLIFERINTSGDG